MATDFDAAFRSLIRDEIHRREGERDFYDMHVQDDEAEAGEAGYAAGTRYWSASGHKLASVAADTIHNHFGVYTRNAPVEDVPDGSPMNKRLSISGGSDDTVIRMMSPSESRLLVSSRGEDGSSNLQFVTAGGNAMNIAVTEPNGVGYLYNLMQANRGPVLSFDLRGDNSIGVNGNPLHGLREITDPEPDDLKPQEWAWDATDSRWLYRESGGEVHWFRPCGTL